MSNKQELGGLFLQEKYGVDGDPDAVSKTKNIKKIC